jgi:hypothetical protein
MKKLEIPQLSHDARGNVTREEAIDFITTFHRIADTLTTRISNSNYKIELAILGLSVITSGGIWVMIGASFPSQAAWFGAAFSTVVTGLTLYQLTLGPKKRVKAADEVYRKTQIELGLLRGGAPFEPYAFWECYKDLEYHLRKLLNAPTLD